MSTGTYAAPDGTSTPASGRARARLVAVRFGEFQRQHPIMQLVALVGFFIVGAATLPGFAEWTTIKTIVILSAFLGIAAMGQQVCVLLGGGDLAVPSFIVLGNFMVPELWGTDHWPFLAAMALLLIVSIVVGGAAGFVCSRFQVHPLIVTLGVSSIVLGSLLAWTGGVVVGGVPTWLSQLSSPIGKTFGISIPPLIPIWFILAIVMWVLLRRTVTGRQIYAAGSNPIAAGYALVPVRRVWMLAFALSAVSAALAGVLLAGFSGTGDDSIGSPYLFDSFAAVIVGGTAFGRGANGDYWRTVLGALLLTELTTIMVGHGFGAAGQQILYGLVILVVVPAYGRARRIGEQV